MSNKIGLSFVFLLAISFVHSFPQLAIDDENGQMSKLMSFVQSINTIAIRALSKSNAKPDESVGKAESYIDLFFTNVFEDDSSEEVIDLAFGPKFNPAQFMALLDDDIEKAFQRKCKKISGSDETFGKIKAAFKEMGGCLKNFLKAAEMRSAYSNIDSEEDVQSLIKTVCRKRHVPMKCMDNYLAVATQCSFPSEIEIDNTVARIAHGVLDSFCANDGNDLLSLVFGQGRQCLKESLNEIMTCSNKELYALVRAIVVKFVEDETFEFKMNADDCKALDEGQNCFVSAVENCVDPTPKNHYISMYQLVRNETECAKIASI